MKKHILLFTTLLLMLSLNSTVAQRGRKKPKSTAEQVADLDTVLKMIRDSYVSANAQLGKEKLKVDIQSASVNFKISRSTSGGGEINILIAKFGKKWSKERESSVTFNFEKPESAAALTDKDNMQDQMTKIIVAAAKRLNSLDKTVLSELSDQSFEVDLTFGITKTTSGGIEIKFFSEAASLGLEGELANAVEQSISLKFKIAK